MVEPPPAPRQAFRQKDIYLAGIAALTALAVQDWNGAVQPGVFSEPTFPSPLRIYVGTITGLATPVKHAVWSVFDTLSHYSQHPEIGFEETLFSTYQDDIRILKGGWLSVDRPVPPLAPSLPGGGAVNLSSVENSSFGLSQGDSSNNISLLLPAAASSPRPPVIPSNAGTSRTPFNITVPDTTTNEDIILSFNFQSSSPLLPPKAVYLALAGFVDHVASRPNTNRVVMERVTDADGIALVELERHATDRRGRGLFVYGKAKGLPRAIAAVLTHDALFVTGYLDVFNGEGQVLLATMTLGKGPRWQAQSVADGDEMVDVA